MSLLYMFSEFSKGHCALNINFLRFFVNLADSGHCIDALEWNIIFSWFWPTDPHNTPQNPQEGKIWRGTLPNLVADTFLDKNQLGANF